MNKITPAVSFTAYQKFAIFLLAITQFSVILDLMIMSPLGDMMMKSMNLKTSQFGIAVSAYALSAGASGLLTAGFADKYDRKKLLVFFYTGFVLGTFFCGVVHTYPLLLAARIFTGLFGGVIGSISMAIIADIFDIQQRGRVMGFVQMGFGASQVLGIPIGIYLADMWGWQAPFLLVAAFAAIIVVLIMVKMQPVNKHLTIKIERDPVVHLLHTIANRNYRIGFLSTALLSLGGFMIMPFGSAFAVNNLGLNNKDLSMLFMLSGLSSLIVMPLVGKYSDKIDKFKLFAVASVWMMTMVVIYTNLSTTPLWLVVIYNILMMMGVMSRMIPCVALTSALPNMQDRGAFMSINTSLQQIAGGIAAAFAGLIVVQKDKTSPIEHYNTLGYVIVAVSILGIFIVYRVDKIIKQKLHKEVL
jgi:predicted MFS family arabinose efflux permease